MVTCSAVTEDVVRFETPEDVHLEFDLAGPASRMAAAMIDYFVIGLVMTAAVLVFVAAGVIAVDLRQLASPETLMELGALAVAVLLFTFTFINVAYFVGCEWFLSGQSLGKRALGLRVVRDGGYALTFGASFLRNVGRLVDMLPGPYFVGLFSVMLSSQRKRLGDFIAGTVVVRHGKIEAPRARFVGETYAGLPDKRFVLTREHLARLDPTSLELLDGYFDRIDRLDPAYRSTLTGNVAAGLAKRMGIELAGRSDEDRAALLLETYLALREHFSAL
jgi:uncharacterized RDD family membrane protein YckC